MEFLVFKWEDINKAVSRYPHLYPLVKDLCDAISLIRKEEGKPENKYLVVNQDEPYADTVVQLMKEYGHYKD